MKGLTDDQLCLLQLLASALFGDSGPLPAEPDWESLMTEARAQAVLQLAFVGAGDRIPGHMVNSLQEECDALLIRNMGMEWQHVCACRWMREAGIPCVVMKGSASAAYYPEPMLRVMGDVDLLVEAVSETEAGRILRSHGFVKEAVTKEDASYHRRTPEEGHVEIELHHSPKGIPESPEGQRTAAALADCVKTARLRRSDVGEYMVPDPFHHGLILLLHTANHMITTGVGLRHLCDWAVFVHSFSPEDFCACFEKALREMGLWSFARILTAVSVRALGCRPQPWATEDVDEALTDALCADIFAGGNFGRKDEQRINQAKLLTDEAKGSVDDTGMLRQLVRTMNEKARYAMPLSVRFPVLLPAAWAYAGGRYLLLLLRGKRPQLKLRRMMQGASRRREIYRQFHLFEACDGQDSRNA